MAHDATPQAGGPQKLVIRNIGLLLTGALEAPILEADTLVAENGRITAVGRAKDVDQEHATLVIDANGTALTPGLFAGARIDVGGDRMVAITVAHMVDSMGGDQYTQVWLGELTS